MGLTGTLDGLTHFIVLAFAAWTLIYDLGLARHLATNVLVAMWVPCLVVIFAGLVFSRAAAAARPVPGPARLAGRTPVRRRVLAVAGVVLGICAGVAYPLGLPWLWTPLLGLAAAVAVGAWLITGDKKRAPDPEVSGAPLIGSVVAACVALAAAILSLFILRPTGDDVYYVSRSVWVAQHGQIPVRDIIFTNQAIKPITGEPPISSIEVMDGALARILRMPAAGFTYQIAYPVLTFISVWAIWLLIRRWAPGRYTLCFIAAMVYLAWDGGKATFGSFHLMMWDGKAAFVSAMVPLLYFYLTGWAENRTKRGLVFVIASGVAAAGFSSAAVYVVPLITAAVAVPLLFNRMFKEASGVALVSAYPLAAGLAAVAGSPLTHIPNEVSSAPAAWTGVMLAGVVGAIAGVALWTAPWLSRRGVPALICAGIGGMAGVLMIPGVIALLGHRLGIGPVLWRVLWVIPAPALAGLLAAVPLPLAQRFRITARMLTPIPAAVLSAALVVSGVLIWSGQNGTRIASHPSWKVKPVWLDVTREILRADHRPGDILSVEAVMGVVPLLTTRVQAVNPRSFYLTGLPTATRQFVDDRQLLTALAQADPPLPTRTALRAALERVGVGYACMLNWDTRGIRLLTSLGFTPTVRVNELQCLRK